MHVPQNNDYECIVWHQKRFNKRGFEKEMNKEKLLILQKSLTEKSFLLTTGDQGSLIVSDVCHDGDTYKRKKENGARIYGKLSVMRQFGLVGEFLSENKVCFRAKQKGKYFRIQRKADGKIFDTALLSDWPNPNNNPKYCAAVFLDEGRLKHINPELKNRHNEPKDHYVQLGPSHSTSLIDYINEKANEATKA